MNYFCGIDPGQLGALAVLDQAGKFVAAHRWRAGKAHHLYNTLYVIKDMVIDIYLENSRIFPREQKGFITQGQGLLVNLGIWQGFAIALGLQAVLIDPATWQAAHKLLHWRKKLEANPGQHSPLTLARALWPTAPLEHLADEGSACALLLADLARQDHQRGLDRAALQAEVAKKKALRRRQARTLKKLEAQSAEESRNPW